MQEVRPVWSKIETRLLLCSMYVSGFSMLVGVDILATKTSSYRTVVLPVIGLCAQEFNNSSSMEGRDPATCVIGNGDLYTSAIYMRGDM
jgi:hypothetical protein